MTPEEWARHPQALAMTEAQLQRGVENLLKAHGWRFYHTHDSRRSQAGFPDLCAVRRLSSRGGDRLLFAELKSQRGRVRPEQQEWMDDLRSTMAYAEDALEVYLWRPADFLAGDIERLLR